MRDSGVGRKYHLGPPEIASFYRQHFSRSNKHNKFWHVVLTEYFHFFLSPIAVSNFHLLKIYSKLRPSLFYYNFYIQQPIQIATSINTFISNIIQYEISIFYWNTHIFYNQIWFKCEAPLLFFQIKTMIYRKKTLWKNKYEKIIELHVVHTWRHMQFE